MATAQQAAGLHPFVSQIKLVNPNMFPDISLTTFTSEEWCQPVISDDFNIYTTKVTTDTTTKTLSVIKLQRQDFHENYFTATSATSPSIGTSANLTPVNIISNSSVLFRPVININNDTLYLYYNDIYGYHIAAYTINGGTTAYDLTPLYQTVVTVDNLANLNGNGNGMFFNNITIFIYYVDGTTLTVVPFNRATGAAAGGVRTIALDQVYTYCNIKMSISNNNTFYITVRSGDVFRMAAYSLAESRLSAFTSVINNTGASPVNPGFISFAKENGIDMCSAVYGFNNDPNNILQVAYIPNTVNVTTGYITGLETPFFYNINKYQLFSEVSSPAQTDMTISVATNPNNTNFVYIAYVTGTSQLRVVKLYRNSIVGTYETHSPLLMWATRLGAIGDQGAGIGMGIVTDSKGAVYVFSCDINGSISMWKIKEYIIDLGHTESTVVSPVDTITNMLQTMTNDYTILTLDHNIHVDGLTQIKDVTIDDIINNEGTISLKFQYINYDLLQGFPSVVAEIKALVNQSFTTLYEDSGISVINMDPNAPALDGDDASIIVNLPIGTAKKPCVVRGTEIIRLTADRKPQRIPVEQVQIGDFVLNHRGKPVRVLDHMRTTIYAESHNAPYVIPKDFFGVNRPYKSLLISGDHGILLNFNSSTGHMKVIYPDDISILSKVLLGVTVEFHHLLLEDHQENFYIANGLEVDSYHPGLFMRGGRRAL